MPYLIDGHNLIGKLSNISLSDLDDEISLFTLLENYFKRIRKKAVVFFDQGNVLDNQQFNGAFVKARFIKKPSTADEAIILELKRLRGNARNYTVVSSDRWIQNAAKSNGAAIIESDFFATMLHETRNNPKNTQKNDENDTDYWLNIFEKGS